MTFHNKLIETIQPEANTTIFNTLKTGDKYDNGVVFKRDETSITVKRNDGWYVTIKVGDYGWDKMIRKI